MIHLCSWNNITANTIKATKILLFLSTYHNSSQHNSVSPHIYYPIYSPTRPLSAVRRLCCCTHLHSSAPIEMTADRWQHNIHLNMNWLTLASNFFQEPHSIYASTLADTESETGVTQWNGPLIRGILNPVFGHLWFCRQGTFLYNLPTIGSLQYFTQIWMRMRMIVNANKVKYFPALSCSISRATIVALTLHDWRSNCLYRILATPMTTWPLYNSRQLTTDSLLHGRRCCGCPQHCVPRQTLVEANTCEMEATD